MVLLYSTIDEFAPFLVCIELGFKFRLGLSREVVVGDISKTRGRLSDVVVDPRVGAVRGLVRSRAVSLLLCSTFLSS